MRSSGVSTDRRLLASLCCLCAFVVIGAGLPGIALGTEPPHAEAGLDQAVYQHETVQLDAGGSHAPDGEIVSYEWEIEAPDGTVLTPECPTCVRSEFVAEQAGTYDVTVTVTDSNDNTDSDTMFVEVDPREPPEAGLDGPDELDVGEEGTVELVDVEGGTYPLTSVVWFENFQVVDVVAIDEPDATTLPVSYSSPGIQQLEAVVVDESGFRTAPTHQIVVGENYAHFDVEILETSSPIEADDTLTVDARIENLGTVADTQYVTLVYTTHADGTTVSLGPGEATEVELVAQPCVPASMREIEVLSHDDRDVAPIETHFVDCPSDEYFEIEGVTGDEAILEGEQLDVTATVTNTGPETGTQTVTLSTFSGTVPEGGTHELTLQPDETAEVELQWETAPGDAGAGDLLVETRNDQATHHATVEQGVEFLVEIEDTQPPQARGDTHLDVTATVTNVGSHTGTQDVRLEGEGTHVDTHSDLNLQPGESQSVTLRWSDMYSDQYKGETVSLTVYTEDDSASTLAYIATRQGFGYQHVWEAQILGGVPDELAPGDRGGSVHVDGTGYRVYYYNVDGIEEEWEETGSYYNDDRRTYHEHPAHNMGTTLWQFDSGPWDVYVEPNADAGTSYVCAKIEAADQGTTVSAETHPPSGNFVDPVYDNDPRTYGNNYCTTMEIVPEPEPATITVNADITGDASSIFVHGSATYSGSGDPTPERSSTVASRISSGESFTIVVDFDDMGESFTVDASMSGFDSSCGTLGRGDSDSDEVTVHATEHGDSASIDLEVGWNCPSSPPGGGSDDDDDDDNGNGGGGGNGDDDDNGDDNGDDDNGDDGGGGPPPCMNPPCIWSMDNPLESAGPIGGLLVMVASLYPLRKLLANDPEHDDR